MNTTPSVSEELKPCPFCGCQLEQRTRFAWAHGTDAACPLSGMGIAGEAIAAWNTRASEPYAGQTDVGLVERLRELRHRLWPSATIPGDDFRARDCEAVDAAIAALLVSNRSGVGQDARLDRAAADSGLAIINELVCVLEDDGKQAALNRAEIIRDRLKQCRDRARATTLEEEG